MHDFLALFTIYRNPSDIPGVFVVRRFVIAGEHWRTVAVADSLPIAVTETLREARLALPAGLRNVGREPDDDPVIVETWI